jgi:two-component system CheB/CheR fusion protein
VVERTMLKQYTPTSIIINDKGEVLYVHGHTGKYLELPTGEMNLNLLNMVREGLKIELTNALRKAVTQKQKIVSEGIQIKQNGEMMTINLTVAPMLEPPEMRDLIMVVIQEVAIQKPAEGEFQLTPGADHDAMIAKLERELRTKEEYLQTTIEELETSNEELKSTNEEFQSSNEELQSTNEELETSKEELQSVNEELVTVNIELQKKIEQLSQSYNDMNNLLASTEIGTVFLDQHLRVMRFTPSITQVMPLIQSDIGRPISDITTNMIYNQLAEDVETVLRTLVFKEVEIQTKIGQWYWMRIMPYRTLENVIDGVVITLVNITKQKEVQHELNKLKRAVEQSNSAVMITNVNGDIEYVNPRFSEVSGYKAEDVLGKNPRLLKSGQHSAEFYAQLWGTLNKGETWRGEFIDKKKNGTIFRELATISPVKDELGHVTHFIAVMETAG